MEYKYPKFPPNFFWGAAASSHQVEGHNTNNWNEWEARNAKRLAKEAKTKWSEWQRNKFPEMFHPDNYISGTACDHYHRFREDFDIAKSLGLNAFRFSLEWSRLEPEPGIFDTRAIEHYREVIRALRERKLEPFVTLWHWPLPLWLANQGGIKNRKFEFYFSRYARRITREFNSDVRFWITFNEPDVYITNAYLRGLWPPQEKSLYSCFKVFRVLVKSHRLAYQAMKKIDPSAQIGIAKSNVYFEAQPNNFLNRSLKQLADFIWNFLWLNKIKYHSDFIGLNHYFHNRIKNGFNKNENKIISDLGWELYPEGIYHVLKDLARYQKPIYITENGLADKDDKHRQWFIAETLKNVQKAIDDNVDVRGYFYWSLTDNFEWDKGFWPRFGLVEIDYTTQKRNIRPSAFSYKNIIEKSKGI